MKFARMQQDYPPPRAIFPRPQILLSVVLTPFLAAAGCVERPTTLDPVPDRPHAGLVLTAAASDPVGRDLLRQLGRSWATRSGAEVRVLDGPWDGTTDIGLVGPAELGRWAEPGHLREAPASLKVLTDPYKWDDLIPVYPNRMITWGRQTCALPVAGEGMVLAYRKDAFDGKDGRPAEPPATWDDLAGYATRQPPGRPCLPPLPAGADRLQAEFFAAAACYDRPAVARLGAGERPGEEFLAFQFDPATGDPRLAARAFVHVAELFRQMQPARSRAADPAAAFRSGEAKVGILSLTELAQVGPDVADELGVAPLPGARMTFDADGQEQRTAQGTVNRVPYLGWGARLGVVSTRCANPAAAWDFLADVGMPDRMALELIAAVRWGAGPYRTSQLDIRARPRWYGYGLSAAETERLTSALRDNLGLGVLNSRVRLRTPNQEELTAALDDELRKILHSDVPADGGMAAANERWARIIRNHPDWRAVARKSLGL